MKDTPKHTPCRNRLAPWLALGLFFLMAQVATSQTVVLEEVVGTEAPSTKKEGTGKTRFGVYLGFGSTFGDTEGNLTVDDWGALNSSIGFTIHRHLGGPLSLIGNVGMNFLSQRVAWVPDQPHPFPDSLHYLRQHIQLPSLDLGLGLMVELRKNRKHPGELGWYLQGGVRGMLFYNSSLNTRFSDRSNDDAIRIERSMSPYLNSPFGLKAYAAVGRSALMLEWEHLLTNPFAAGKLPHDINIAPMSLRLVLNLSGQVSKN